MTLRHGIQISCNLDRMLLFCCLIYSLNDEHSTLAAEWIECASSRETRTSLSSPNFGMLAVERLKHALNGPRINILNSY